MLSSDKYRGPHGERIKERLESFCPGWLTICRIPGSGRNYLL